MVALFTTAFIPGLSLGLSLIVAIGAQNAFVLRQGLRQEHVFAVCLVCAFSDALLIAAGVAGFGQIIAKLPWLEPVMRYGGAAFLMMYAIRSFIAATRIQAGLSPLDGPTSDFKKTLITVISFTWLNPHVYLDTVILLGSVSTQYTGHKVAFALGAMSGSVLFFFSLGYGAHYLRPLFASPISWRVLDIVIGCIMTSVALSLIL
ncbi:MAG: amino acid transporter [Acidocella sp. 20-61-6]|nr:MAG: amino acid transporter [Acidocella sp. 20-61-6]